MPALTVKAPGKTILFGEHAVVFGYPAIAVPINSIQLKINIFPSLEATNGEVRYINRDSHENILFNDLPAEHYFKQAIGLIQEKAGIKKLPAMEIHIQSSIPTAAGLGSSAAFAVALSRSVFGFLGFDKNNEEINKIAYEIEKIQHGNPSGVDNTVIVYNQPVFFRKNAPLKLISISKQITFVIADTGIRVPTKKTVQEVKLKFDRNKEAISSIFQKIGEIADKAFKFLTESNIEALGSLMTQNHSLLQDLCISSESLDNLVKTANQTHALGAKLCGGGKGGSIVAVVSKKDAEELKNSLLSAGANSSFIFQLKPTLAGN